MPERFHVDHDIVWVIAKGTRCVAGVVLALGVVSAAFAGPLQDAAKVGDVELARQLIDRGADLNARAGFGTALHWAILSGHDDVAVLLIDRGADVNISTRTLGAPLHSAAAAGDTTITLILLERGADANAPRLGDSFTPLHIAAQRGDARLVHQLVDHGADVNALASVGSGECTALHLAELGGHAEAAATLRAAGAAPPKLVPIGELMTTASAERGRELMSDFGCGECHRLANGDPEQQNGRGPPLAGIVGRPVASVEGYDYSAGLRRLGGRWTAERLVAFIRHPMVLVPGTRMEMDASGEPQELADVVAYLQTLRAQ